MPGQVRPVTDEQDGLLAYLAQMRYVIRLTAYGLTPEQLRAVPSASELSVGGLIRHCAATEEGWMSTVRGEHGPVDYEAYERNFRLADGESVEELFAYYNRVAEATEKTVRDIADLDHPVPIDHSVPWNPKEYDAWSLRWVLLHLIQETARHTGHADVIRQTVDGATAYPLMAAAEGWPESPWMKPWKPQG
ncbi:DinB family protein [Actinoplanes hulinensis]|uniref:DinB family protein n=1 Tax=Actinoplanes hulinensis TaxID=1144547 RepID=A0ABS7BBB1_9ACTN|nr:DinB family protein [Actinoplanes hulinensis]MBW6438326.1 DinB family protein [Actinoplanes hulinensis]